MIHKRQEEAQKKVNQQNEQLKECLKMTNETVSLSNETNLELHKQSGTIKSFQKSC